MKVAVTGATGFLGNHICSLLVAAGYNVIGLGRDVQKGASLLVRGIDFWQGDLREPVRVDAHRELDVVIHCAGLSSAWGTRKDFFENNVTGTSTALNLARQCQASRFVFISSPSVAFQFRDQFDLSEDAISGKPVNAYAWSKMKAEQLVTAAVDLDPIILRPRGIYGPGQTQAANANTWRHHRMKAA